jgi:hypothetical protein
MYIKNLIDMGLFPFVAGGQEHKELL